MGEFGADGLPGVSNPFDPEQITVDGLFRGPDGSEVRMPAFWYQGYARRLSGDTEVLDAVGAGGWRLRFTPRAPGSHTVALEVSVGGQPFTNTAPVAFRVEPAAVPPLAFADLGTNGMTLATREGPPLILLGHCVCWHGARGTYDYDSWFGPMAAAGENYTRLWMCPWAFGLETIGRPVTHYRLDRAWQLDYVLQLAEQKGIRIMLCLDYHGMFETEPDFWNGNNYWPQNPYNVAMGGPCAHQNDFFADPAARAMYQKRLRYLIARYAASPALLAWQFLNEIDNVWSDLQPADVVSWHAVMADWLKAHDPYRHLVTTSLTGGSDRSEIWSLPQLDFAMYHSYNLPDPAVGLAAQATSMRRRYGKPVMIGEFGIDWRGWRYAGQDPDLRGFRQGIWAGLLGGSVGTSMSWYWESIHAENLYGTWRNASNFLARAQFGQGNWEPIAFPAPAVPPSQVGPVQTNGTPFSARLILNDQWGAKPRGQMALPYPSAALESEGLLSGFVHGTGHPELRVPMRVHLWSGTNASLTLHLNSVSDGAIMEIRTNSTRAFRISLPNLDGGYQVNNEYNTNFTVALPPGQIWVDVVNAGGDWFCLDWLEFSNVRPASYVDGWEPAPVAIGVRSSAEALLYVASPYLRYPARVPPDVLVPVSGATLALTNWPAGSYTALWFDPVQGNWRARTRAAVANSQLVLPLPDFTEDLAGRVVRDGVLSARRDGPEVAVDLDAVAPLVSALEWSTNLVTWTKDSDLTNAVGAGHWRVMALAPVKYYRSVTE